MTQNERAAEAAAEWWTTRLLIGDKIAFKDSLRAAVLSALNEKGECFLEVDYDPRGPLLDAVRAAGIDCNGSFFSAAGILPSKHSLEITPTQMEPKEGYGSWLPAIELPKHT